MKCTTHQIEMDVETECGNCHGEGLVEDWDDYADPPRMTTCHQCRGSGRGWDDCELCLQEDRDDI